MSKLAIYAGHGGTDSGAVGNGYKEKDCTLQIMTKLTEYMKAVGYEVINNRTTDVSRNITADANKANSAKVDAVIEIHLNAGGGTGTETYCSISGGKGKELATAINTQIVSLGYKDRGVKTKTNSAGKDYFGIIRQTNAPCVLIEVCFIDSANDMAKFNAENIAQAISLGITSILGAKTTQNTTSSTASTKATVRNGSKGSAVKELQTLLNKKGYKCGTADGIFGAKTLAAVKSFQKANKLTVDGIVGKNTWAALYK